MREAIDQGAKKFRVRFAFILTYIITIQDLYINTYEISAILILVLFKIKYYMLIPFCNMLLHVFSKEFNCSFIIYELNLS